ncbi:hypothetical protein DL98DRAFT_618941 [Cadophora sp. DSE1049]|nr:hypothetical protein DL98DRAFT_618941 [Cadophora sp. DSE1049]
MSFNNINNINSSNNMTHSGSKIASGRGNYPSKRQPSETDEWRALVTASAPISTISPIPASPGHSEPPRSAWVISSTDRKHHAAFTAAANPVSRFPANTGVNRRPYTSSGRNLQPSTFASNHITSNHKNVSQHERSSPDLDSLHLDDHNLRPTPDQQAQSRIGSSKGDRTSLTTTRFSSNSTSSTSSTPDGNTSAPDVDVAELHLISPLTQHQHNDDCKTDRCQPRQEAILKKPTWRVAPSHLSTSAPVDPTSNSITTLKEDITQETFQYNSDIPPRVQELGAKVENIKNKIEQVNRPIGVEGFRPSRAALEATGLLDTLGWSNPADENSSKYRGDLNIPSNHSANIREEWNCSLWVTGLPVEVTYRELFSSVRNIGKIVAIVTNALIDEFSGCAAKIVFFERQPAENLFALISSGGFYVMGHLVRRVSWNRVKVGRYCRSEQSRAIRITGPKELMDFDFFELFFKMRFTYDLDRRGEVECNEPDMVCHEWHFGSVRAQAQSAMLAIKRELSPMI